MSKEPITITATSGQEKKRRRRELIIALAAFVLIAVLTFVQLNYSVDYLVFTGLISVNFILVLLVLFFVIRNTVKLVIERRRNVLGSKMRTRLVLSFVTISLVPVVLMFLVSVKFVQTSVDYWFKAQIEESMEQSLALSQTFYRATYSRLMDESHDILNHIVEAEYAWGGQNMDDYLDQRMNDLGLGFLGIVTPGGHIQNQHYQDWVNVNWPDIKDGYKANVQANDSQSPVMMTMDGKDYVILFTPVDEGKTGQLVLGAEIGTGMHSRFGRVIGGLNEYKNLKSSAQPFKTTLYMTLGIMTGLIIFGAMWFGFRLAKELSAPIQALASGTKRVAAGDLDVQLEDSAGDEMGVLVTSFNQMTQDLRQGQQRIKTANERLARQNLELERRGRYIEAVIDNITSGVISMSRDGLIQSVNKAAQQMFNVPAPLLIGKQGKTLLRGEFSDILEQALAHIGEKPDSVWQRQLDLPIRGKNYRFMVNIVALTSGGDSYGVVAVFEDITELERSQRQAAWREVARRIAHEIKNPLTPIKLSAQRLQRKFGPDTDDKAFEECTRLIVSQVERMQQMVTQFSSYAKLPEVQPRPDYLAPLIEETVAMFRSTHRNIEWTLDFESPIPEIPFDQDGIRRVFINLLTNAAEALKTQPDGRVKVTAGHDPKRGLVTIGFYDNGPGVPNDDTQRLFEPYFSSKKGGTGLGLTIVRSIVADHDGNIQLMPNPSGGTIFIVELPDK